MTELTFMEDFPIGNIQRNTTIVDNSILYPFLRRIEGYKTNLKGHHWHGYNNSAHVRIDEYLSEISELQDILAEAGMDIYGVMPLGFTSIPSENWNILELTQNIIDDAITVHHALEPDDKNIGLINAIEDFIQNANQKRYLIKLSLNEGYK